MNRIYILIYFLFMFLITSCKSNNQNINEETINESNKIVNDSISINKDDVQYIGNAIFKKENEVKGNEINSRYVPVENLPDTTYIEIYKIKQLGEECEIDAECVNNNCQKHIRAHYCSLKEGDIFPDIELNNQFEEMISLNKFKGKDKYILLEMATVWCSPCNDLAGWLAYGENNIKSKIFWKPEYDRIYNLIKNKQVQLVTVLYEDEFRNTATIKTSQEWYSTFTDENTVILADENREMQNLIKATGIPAISLLNSNLEVVVLSTRGINEAFDKLLENIE